MLESKLLQRVDLDKSHIVSDPLTCDLTLFPTKIARGETRGDKALILTDLDSPMVEIFQLRCLFFVYLQGEMGRKI